MEILEIKKQASSMPIEEKKKFIKGLIKDQKKIKFVNDVKYVAKTAAPIAALISLGLTACGITILMATAPALQAGETSALISKLNTAGAISTFGGILGYVGSAVIDNGNNSGDDMIIEDEPILSDEEFAKICSQNAKKNIEELNKIYKSYDDELCR